MMGKGYCYAGEREMTASEVNALIGQAVAKGCALVEQFTQVTFEALDAQPLNELGLQGWAFSEAAEVRWRRTNPVADAFTVLVLAETGLSLGQEWLETEFDSTHESSQVLWGKWSKDKDGWVEARIPHVQRYPVQGSGKQPLARLKAIEYRQRGVTRLTRLAGIEAIPDQGGE